MKIMYLIYCRGVGGRGYTGKGGHYYSVLETARAMAKEHDVVVCSLGTSRSPVLEGSGVPYFHISVKGVLGGFDKFFRLANEIRPDVLNAFDTHSLLWARTYSWWKRIPLVLTKCGGPNPRRYYPRAPYMVLYSRENLEYFESNKRFSKTKFALIPNRINVEVNCKVDTTRIEKLSKMLASDAITLLRIARIGFNHKRSIEQSINLTKALNEQGIKTQLLVIGTVQSQTAFDDLSKNHSDYIYFVTDKEFTVKASQVIDVADMVIGTGRGFMEAALLGKKMLVPTANADIPMLVNKAIFNEAFYFNFSPRCISKKSRKQKIDEIIACLREPKNDMMKIYEENFSSTYIGDKYSPIYKISKPVRFDIFDYLANFLLVALR